MKPSIILDPASARALLNGRKTQVRMIAGRGRGVFPIGARIYGQEACAPGRMQDGREVLTDLGRAEFVAFADGWRRDRAGQGWQGVVPHDPNEMWVSAVRMPIWACRVMLEVRGKRTDRLQDISTQDLLAEGIQPILAGLLWQGARPLPGLHWSARRAFAAHWDVTHPVPGLRWADNPIVEVLDVALANQAFLPRATCSSSAAVPSTSASVRRLRS